MERRELERAVTSNRYLRGLLAIPFGMILIVAALGNLEWGPFRPLWVVPACLLVAGAAYLAILRYYIGHYGRMSPRPNPVRDTIGPILGVAVMIGGQMLVQVLDLPLNGLAVASALVALVYFAVTVGLKAHQVVIWGSVLLVGLVPLWGDPGTTNTSNVGLLLVGAAVMATGILDHRLLVTTFGSSQAVALENDNVGA